MKKISTKSGKKKITKRIESLCCNYCLTFYFLENKRKIKTWIWTFTYEWNFIANISLCISIVVDLFFPILFFQFFFILFLFICLFCCGDFSIHVLMSGFCHKIFTRICFNFYLNCVWVWVKIYYFWLYFKFGPLFFI